MIDLSIIIVNYNTFSVTTNCIRSIYRSISQIRYEIILVDNSSTERDPHDFLIEFPHIRLIPLTQNVGFGRGNNEGIKIATGKVILLLNSDTIVLDDAIEKTYHFLMNDTSIGLVGCKLLNEDQSEQASSYIPVKHPLINLLVSGNPLLEKINKALGLKEYNHNYRTFLLQKQTHDCEAVSGAYMMFRREVIDKCGPFDPDFFMYSEEIEWCKNRIAKHYRIVYYAEAAIVHLGGRSSLHSYRQGIASSFLYIYKTSYWDYIVAILIYYVNSITVIFLLPLMKKETRKILWPQSRAFLQIAYYLFYDIPRYSQAFGSRGGMLIV